MRTAMHPKTVSLATSSDLTPSTRQFHSRKELQGYKSADLTNNSNDTSSNSAVRI